MTKKMYQLCFWVAVLCGFMMGLSDFNGVVFYFFLVLALIDMICVIVLFFIGKKDIEKKRTIVELDIEHLDNFEGELEKFIKDYLMEKKFVLADYANGERVYQLGNGIWSAKKFLTYHFENEKLILEAWVSLSAGKAISDEIPLDDKFFARVPKRKLKNIIDEFAARLNKLREK